MAQRTVNLKDLKPVDQMLIGQYDLISRVCTNVEFIIALREFDKEEAWLKEKDHVNYIFELAKSSIYTEFYNVINSKEGLSFTSIIREVRENPKTYPDSKDNISFEEIKKKHRELQKIFNRLKLDKIRNQYIAHSHRDKDSFSVEWKEMVDIKDRMIDLHTKISMWALNAATIFNLDHMLTSYLRETIIHHKIKNLVWSKYQNQEELTKEEVWELYQSGVY